MSSSETRSSLPTGCEVLCNMPDCLFIAEMVFGGLVWILMIVMASHHWISLAIPVWDWVLVCSVACFLVSTVWLCVFCFGANDSRIWLKLDAGYHVLATLMYLSASICLAIITAHLSAHKHKHVVVGVIHGHFAAATVLAFITTILYFIHALYSVIRSNRAGYIAI